jgi:8-oxo-dGTP pyrophosphatase MutT (NUDIX family)
MRTRFERSAGGVVVQMVTQADHPIAVPSRPADPGGVAYEVVLASRRRRDGSLAWGLPKGLVEPGEEPSATAVREVREETGLDAVISEPLGDVSYVYVWEGERVRKKVTFYLMRAIGGDVSRHDHEMEEVRWFPMADAIGRADYRGERDMIERAAGSLGVAPA